MDEEALAYLKQSHVACSSKAHALWQAISCPVSRFPCKWKLLPHYFFIKLYFFISVNGNLLQAVTDFRVGTSSCITQAENALRTVL